MESWNPDRPFHNSGATKYDLEALKFQKSRLGRSA